MRVVRSPLGCPASFSLCLLVFFVLFCFKSRFYSEKASLELSVAAVIFLLEVCARTLLLFSPLEGARYNLGKVCVCARACVAQ